MPVYRQPILTKIRPANRLPELIRMLPTAGQPTCTPQATYSLLLQIMSNKSKDRQAIYQARIIGKEVSVRGYVWSVYPTDPLNIREPEQDEVILGEFATTEKGVSAIKAELQRRTKRYTRKQLRAARRAAAT
jgi:hypothetical protein